MKNGRIKVDWASLSLAHDGCAIGCIKYNGAPCCIRFNSIEQLRQAIDRKKILVKKWVTAVPRSSCILKRLVLPAPDLAEAVKMIEFELPSLVPLPPEELVYGCTLLNKQNNMLNVLVCILKINTLNEHLKPYRAIGIEPHRITLDLLAIQGWFNTVSPNSSCVEINTLVNRNNCVVLTCIDGSFHKANELTFSSVEDRVSSHEVAQEILNQQEELPPSLREKTVVLLAGEEKQISVTKDLLHSILYDRTVTPKIAVVASPQITRYESSKHDQDGSNLRYEAIVATGLLELATNSRLPHSNLLPKQYVRRYQRKTLLSNYLLTGLLSLGLILLLWLSLLAANWRIERISKAIELQIAPIEQIAGSVDSKRQRVKAIQNQLSNRGQITRALEELYKFTPKTISISEIKFIPERNGASIEIKGQADLLANAFEYTDAMQKADLLGEIQVINAQQIPRPGGSVVEFKAYCAIQNE